MGSHGLARGQLITPECTFLGPDPNWRILDDDVEQYLGSLRVLR